MVSGGSCSVFCGLKMMEEQSQFCWVKKGKTKKWLCTLLVCSHFKTTLTPVHEYHKTLLEYKLKIVQCFIVLRSDVNKVGRVALANISLH